METESFSEGLKLEKIINEVQIDQRIGGIYKEDGFQVRVKVHLMSGPWYGISRGPLLGAKHEGSFGLLASFAFLFFSWIPIGSYNKTVSSA